MDVIENTPSGPIVAFSLYPCIACNKILRLPRHQAPPEVCPFCRRDSLLKPSRRRAVALDGDREAL